MELKGSIVMHREVRGGGGGWLGLGLVRTCLVYYTDLGHSSDIFAIIGTLTTQRRNSSSPGTH